MKRIKNIIFVIFAICLSGCGEKEWLVEVKDDGKLVVILQDGSGNPIANEMITLYSGGGELDKQTTDENGKINFGQLFSKSYTISGEDILSGGKEYSFSDYIHVVSGETTKHIVNIEEFVGDVKVTVMTSYIPVGSFYSVDTAVANVKVVAIPQNDAYNDLDFPVSFEDYYALKYDEKVSNSNGVVNFYSLPAGLNYAFLVYYDSNNYDIETWGTFIEKFDENEIEIDVNITLP